MYYISLEKCLHWCPIYLLSSQELQTDGISTEQGLFSSPADHSPLSSGQVSPLITTGLRDGTVKQPNYPSREFEGIITVTSGNMFLSASGQNSPIEALSPASTSSGDRRLHFHLERHNYLIIVSSFSGFMERCIVYMESLSRFLFAFVALFVTH